MKVCKHCGIEYDGMGDDYCSRACSNKDRRINERSERPTYTVYSCGGGVQSTAIAALIYNGVIPKPDYAVMVDTGYEKTAVMEYVRGTLVPKLAEVGVTLEIIKTSDYVDQHLMTDQGYCVIPIFKPKGDGAVKLRTNCNGLWKLTVIRKWLLEQGVEQYRSLIGISTDESHRQRKAHKMYYENTYPLIGLGMDRDDCLEYIRKTGWAEPTRSSCYICGQQDDGEWWSMLAKHPEDFQKAVAIERELQSRDKNIYLHRKCKPIDEIFKL